MKKILFMTIMFFTLPCLSNIYLKEKSMDEEEFNYILGGSLDGVSLKQFLTKYKINQEGEHLIETYFSAKKAMSKKHNEEAKHHLSQIISQAYNKNWRVLEQKVIYKSFIDLAQVDLKNQKKYLLAAMGFDVSTNFEVLLEDQKIKDKYFKLKNETIKVQWKLPKEILSSHVFVNGQRVQGPTVMLFPSTIYLCIYSNHYLPFEKKIQVTELDTQRFLIPIYQNKKALYDFIPKEKHQKVFFVKGPHEFKKMEGNFQREIQPVGKTSKKQKVKSKNNNWWIWGIVGLGVVFYYNSQKNKSSHSAPPPTQENENTQPTITIGF